MNLTFSSTEVDQFPVSINDIRDKYFENAPLSRMEHKALANFDKFRVDYLNASQNEEEFEKRYLEIQAKANLNSFEYFLDEKNLQY